MTRDRFTQIGSDVGGWRGTDQAMLLLIAALRALFNTPFARQR